MSEIEEMAKATQEVAKLGTKGLEVAEKAGGFFAKVLALPAHEISGIITDKLRFIRWSRMVEMEDKVNKILHQKGVTVSQPVAPKIALPIFEGASLEDDPTLQTLWNNLLANAMNPDFNNEIRYGFTEMINNITAQEALLLNFFYTTLLKDKHHRPLDKVIDYSLKKEIIMNILSITAEQYAVCANNLMRMQLLSPAIVVNKSIYVGPELVTTYKGIDEITLTALGVLFIEACMK